MKNINRLTVCDQLAIILMVICTIQSYCKADQIDDLLHAIHVVESGCRVENVPDGDDGRAIGPFQIWRVYWQDAIEAWPQLGGTYEDCRDYDYARRVVLAYWYRYATKKRIGDVTAEKLARIHNGGPNGHKREITIKYWNKVKNELQKMEETCQNKK